MLTLDAVEVQDAATIAELSEVWIFSDAMNNPLGNFDDFEFMFRPEDANPDVFPDSIHECTIDTCDPCTIGQINSGCTTCCNPSSYAQHCAC